MLKYILVLAVIILLTFTGAIAELEDEFDLMIPDEESEKVISSSFRAKYPDRVFDYRTQVKNWWINSSYFWNANFFGDTMFWEDVFIFDGSFIVNTNYEEYFMWDATKTAFRAGYYEGTQLDTIGTSSYSMGVDAEAKGHRGISIGHFCESNASNSYSLGHNSLSKAPFGYAIGHEAVAKDTNCVSLGYQTEANKEYSIALGNNSKTWDYSQISHSNGTGWNYSTNYTLSKETDYGSGVAQKGELELLAGLPISTKDENITCLDSSLCLLTGTIIGTTEGADSSWIYKFETACTFDCFPNNPSNVYESITTIAESDTSVFLDLIYYEGDIKIRMHNESDDDYVIRWNANVEGNFVQFK